MLSFGYSKLSLLLVLITLFGSHYVKSESIVSRLSAILQTVENIERILEHHNSRPIPTVQSPVEAPSDLNSSSENNLTNDSAQNLRRTYWSAPSGDIFSSLWNSLIPIPIYSNKVSSKDPENTESDTDSNSNSNYNILEQFLQILFGTNIDDSEEAKGYKNVHQNITKHQSQNYETTYVDKPTKNDLKNDSTSKTNIAKRPLLEQTESSVYDSNEENERESNWKHWLPTNNKINHNQIKYSNEISKNSTVKKQKEKEKVEKSNNLNNFTNININNGKEKKAVVFSGHTRNPTKNTNSSKDVGRGTIIIHQSSDKWSSEEQPSVEKKIVVRNEEDVNRANDIIMDINNSLLKYTGVTIPLIDISNVKQDDSIEIKNE